MAHISILRRGGKGGRSSTRKSFDSSELTRALEDLSTYGEAAMVETTPILAELLASAMQDVFEAEGAVGGAPPWAPFAWERDGLPKPNTRRFSGSSPKLLKDTGLMSTIHTYSEALLAEAFSNAPYAGYHVSKRARRKIPLRDFTAIDWEAAEEEMLEIVLAQMTSGGP